MQRECDALAGLGLARKIEGRWHVQREALLRGKPAGHWVRGGAGVSPANGLPPGHESWTDKDRRRYFDTNALITAWRRWLRGRRGPRDGLAPVFAATRASDVGLPLPPKLNPQSAIRNPQSPTVAQWVGDRGLSTTTAALQRYARRLPIDGNIDRRGRGGPDQPDGFACDPSCWEMFKDLWLAPQRRTVALCWEVVKAQAERDGLAWPALRTIQARVQAELPEFHADYYRLGAAAWNNKHGPRIERDLSRTPPNHTWVGDHAKLDFLALHEGRPIRPWLTAWQDQRSRMIVGWKITAGPDSDTILAAFKLGVIAHGAPLRLIIDNGKDYRAKGFSGGKRRRALLDQQRVTSVCGRLGVGVAFCEVLNPGAKCIESFFGGLHERFDKLFDSYCGRNPQHRPEDLYERLREDRVELPTLDDVVVQLAKWLDAFHRRPHSGDAMHGLCPLDVMERCDPIPCRTLPRDLLGEALKKTVKVKVSRNGVRYHGVRYGQGELKLRPLHGQKVLLAIDPDHAEHLDVRTMAGEHVCRVYNQRLAGLDHDDIKQARRRRKAARKLAQSIGPAYREASKTVVELAIAAQYEQAEQLRKAAGAEHLTGPARQRAYQLLPASGAVSELPPPVEREFTIDDLDWDEAPLDEGPVSALDSMPDDEVIECEPDMNSPLDDDLGPLLDAADDAASALDELPDPVDDGPGDRASLLDAWPDD